MHLMDGQTDNMDTGHLTITKAYLMQVVHLIYGSFKIKKILMAGHCTQQCYMTKVANHVVSMIRFTNFLNQ